MKSLLKLPLTVCALALGIPAAQAAGFSDNFNSIDPAWATDRYEPAGFQSTFFDGDLRLQISISTNESAANRPGGFSGTFYNTQGRQRPAEITGLWNVSGDLYVSSEMLSGANLRRTDLWARTGTIGTEAFADYPIFGIIRNDPADPFNPLGALASSWRVWDPEAGGYVYLANPITAGWNNLSIEGDATSYTYRLNGVAVYTDTTVTLPQNLTAVLSEAYNFGDANYSVYWDNINATAVAVPEPTAAALGMIGGLGLFLNFRRRSVR